MFFKCDNVFSKCFCSKVSRSFAFDKSNDYINRMPQHVEISIFPKVSPSHSSRSAVLIAFVFSKLPVTFADICLFFVFFLAFSRSNVV